MAAAERRPRVLVLCLDEVGPAMAGVAIRSCEIARALTPHVEVTLVAARVAGDPEIGLPVRTYDRHDSRSLAPLLAGADAVFAQPQWPLVAAALRRSGARLIHDLYAPEALETLAFRAADPPRRRRLITAMTTDRTVEALHAAHHVVAASERQLDLSLGVLLAERGLGPTAYDRDPTFASRLGIVPHGLPAEPPQRSGGPGLRGSIPGISADDEVVLWNSAIWEWLDAETAIRAVAELAQSRPRLRLVFMGLSDNAAGRAAGDRAVALAGEVGLLDRHVFFNRDWVPYAERGDWLLDADCAVSCQELHLETRFAFRTRFLDCFWSGLPLVCTEGDVLADRVAAEDLGATVPQCDPRALAAALERVLDRGRDAFAPQLARVAADYAWPRAVEPILEFLRAPLPPRLGEGTTRRPSHVVRDVGYRVVRGALNRRPG